MQVANRADSFAPELVFVKIVFMKNFENRDRRTINQFRFQAKGILSCRRALSNQLIFLLSICLLSLFALVPVFSLSSCDKAELLNSPPPQEEVPVDSTFYKWSLALPDGIEARRLDLFIYNGKKEMVHCLNMVSDLSLDFSKGLELNLPTGPKTAVAVFNSPRDFNVKALESFEKCALISYSFEDDNPGCPVMGAIAEEGDTLRALPLFSKIKVKSVSNTMDDYVLLENPRVRLRNMNASAQLFGKTEYLPSEFVDKGEWKALPYDVGMFREETDIDLFCYPNDSEDSEYAPDRTVLELEALVEGKLCSYLMACPRIPRNTVLEAEITVYSESSADCRFSSPAALYLAN